MKKIKLIIFILLIVSLLFILFFSIFGTQLSYLSVKEIKESRKLKEDLITELKINDIDAIFEKIENKYYYMIPDEYENDIYILKLGLDNSLKYKIIDETLNIIKVNYQKNIRVIIYNDKYYCEIKIQLTNLPLINILTDEEITSYDTNSIFQYINNDESKETNYNFSKIHVRGESSKNLPKKSYKIEFYDKDYLNDVDIKLTGFDKGNSLILDALYRDPSKIRNLLSTDIWNQISQDFTNVNINSKFVELFINNEYKGLYVLTEPIKRKKLKLSKSNDSNTSIVIKTIGWNTEVNKDFEYIYSSSYKDYEIKYPNNEELFSTVWNKFLNLISDYYNPEIKNTDSIIKNTFNIKNYTDIIIFNSFITNVDSCLGRNVYFYMNSLNSNEVYIQPWDLEFSYGHYYNPDSLHLLEYNKIYCEFYHEDSPEINEFLIDRYWELRKSVLTEEYFDKLLDYYKEKLNKGAAKRDSDVWYEYDIEKEIEQIRTWLHKRLEFFDEYVRGIKND